MQLMKIVWCRRLVNEFFHCAQQSATWRIVSPLADVIINHVPGVITALGYRNAVRTVEGPVALEVLVDTKAPFVHQRVVLRAQQHQLVHHRLAAISPVVDVVDIDKALVATPWETASVLVPGTHRALDAFRDDA